MRAPDREGSNVRAWQIAMKEDTPGAPTTVAAWMVHAPGHHAFWSWWIICTIHLRDLPGYPPAVKTSDNNTHETMFAVLNPEFPPPDPDDFKDPQYLEPFDLVTQYQVRSDEDARLMTEKIVELITSGVASPDSDWQRYWTKTLAATAEHLMRGLH